MKKIIIVNGPNLNLLGQRETDIYGNKSFEDFFNDLKNKFSSVKIEYYQSNIEGEIIDKLQEVGFSLDGIILNAAQKSCGCLIFYSYIFDCVILLVIKNIRVPCIIFFAG